MRFTVCVTSFFALSTIAVFFLLFNQGLAGEADGTTEFEAEKTSIPKEFRDDCEITVDVSSRRIVKNQGIYVVIQIKNTAAGFKSIICPVSNPLPLFTKIAGPNENLFVWMPIWLPLWEKIEMKEGLKEISVASKERIKFLSWFILCRSGYIFDRVGKYTLYIYGKKFEIEVVEGKSWMADRELTDLFLGSEQEVEARKAKLRKILPDYKDPLDQIAGRLALGQKEEALKLARQSMPELAALLVEDANAKKPPEKVEPPNQPVPEKKTAGRVE